MSMRVFVGVLAALGVGAMSLALADPSASAPASEAAPAKAAAPAAAATPAAPAAAAAKPEVDPFEKHLIAEGYRPEMQNGDKVYCRKETPLGSRLGGVKSCGTAEQLKLREDQTKQGVDQAQRASVNPKGS
jgi:hypothetical protein